MSRPVLVIQCGGAKKAGVHPVAELYLGPLWSTYRARLRERLGLVIHEPLGEHPDFEVYVLSAEHGLVSERRGCPAYDRVLVSDRYAGVRKGGAPVRKIRTILPRLRSQLSARGLLDRPLHVAAGRLYREALERAGAEVVPVSEGDLLAIRGALSELLRSSVGSAEATLDLAALFG